jgi:hypothetical protein
LKAFLAVLFLGPLLAPLFQATQVPVVADSGALARELLARYICPTPAKSYMLLGFPMAVCARCWGATIGLWAAWLALKATKDQGPRTNSISSLVFGLWSLALMPLKGYILLPWPVRLAIGAVPFGLWAAEIDAWPAAPLWVLLANGALAGFAAGLFICSSWLRLRRG